MARPRTFAIDWQALGLDPKQASLYAAYGNKEQMFAQSLARYLAWLAGELATKAQGLAAIRAVLSSVARLTIEDKQRRGCPLINAISEIAVFSATTRATVEGGLDIMHGLLRSYVVQADRSRHSAKEIDELASLLLAASISLRVLGRAHAPDAMLMQVVEGACAAAKAWMGRPDRPKRQL